MTIVHSVPVLALQAAACALALLARFGVRARFTGFLSVMCASFLIVLVLLEGGTLYEALAYLLVIVWLLLPKERGSTL